MSGAPFADDRTTRLSTRTDGGSTRPRGEQRYVSRCCPSARAQRGPDVKLAVIFDHFFKFNGGLQFIARWLHVLSGIAWIGLLYFFNFVQTPSFAELGAGARNEAFDKV